MSRTVLNQVVKRVIQIYCILRNGTKTHKWAVIFKGYAYANCYHAL